MQILQTVKILQIVYEFLVNFCISIIQRYSYSIQLQF